MERAYGPHQCCGAIFIMAFVSSGVSCIYLSMLEVGAIQMLPVLPGTNRPSEAYARLFSGNEVSFDYIYKYSKLAFRIFLHINVIGGTSKNILNS